MKTAPVPTTSNRSTIVETADYCLAQWPQYKGCHDNQNAWRVVELKKDVRTKMGQSFLKGDFSIGAIYKGEEDSGWVTVFSFRTGIHTSVKASWIKWLDGAPTEAR